MTGFGVNGEFVKPFQAGGIFHLLDSQGLGHLLFLFWTGILVKNSEGKRQCELKINHSGHNIIGCDDEDERSQLLRYSTHFAGCTIRSCYDDNVNSSLIDRVFKKFSPEMSPDISFYSQHEYPHRDFALSCGIRTSFCFPFNKYCPSGYPDGVLEIVSTRNQDVGTVRIFCESLKMLGYYLTFQSLNLRDIAIPETVHLLEVLCQTYQLPLAQYWMAPNQHEPLRVVHQLSYRDFKNLEPWCQFKDACLHKRLGMDEGPLGNPRKSRRAFFYSDMTALSITEYPFAHYARNCGSISCFTIYLCSISQQNEDCVLQFFLPAEEMDNSYPQTFLNSLWTTIRECLPYYMLASGEQLGQVLPVLVFTSTHNEPETLNIGQHDSFLPHHESSGYIHTLNLFENGTGQRSNSNSSVKAASGDTSKRIPDQVTEITLDILEEESHIKGIEPQSLVSQPKRPVDILEIEVNPVEREHSASEMTLEEPSKLKKHNVTAERVNNLVEISPAEGIEYAVTPASKRLKKSKIPCTVENISKQFGRPLKDAAESFGVSVSTFKRRCRDVGISWWQPGKSKIIDGEPGDKNFSSGMPNLLNRPVVVTRASEDFNTMTVKVTYNTDNIRFLLPSSSGIAELENNVIERLPLDRKSFSLKYQDDEGDWVLIACDKDVQECMKMSRSSKKTTIKMLLGPPISSYAP